MKFVHIADMHFDIPFTSLNSVEDLGEKRRIEQRNAFRKLIEYIKPIYDNPEFKNKYWVDFQDAHLSECSMYIKRLNREDIIEFNTLKALKQFDANFKATEQSETMQFICKKLLCNEDELYDFIPIKEANKAIGSSFYFKDKKYIYLSSTQKLEMTND